MERADIPRIIETRRSVRTFAGAPVERDALLALITCAGPGPFGTSPRYALVNSGGEGETGLKKIGTYGFIKGSPAFIAGAIRDNGMAPEDFGFVTEGIVLECTAMGLGTCWLGGTFPRSSFAAHIGLDEDETIPAVIAVGRHAGKRRPMEKVIRWGAGSDGRKPPYELFFHREWGRPLERESAGAFADILAMVRRAPSASNNQPWRAVLDESKPAVHFYLERTPGYAGKSERLFGFSDLQRVDMGIALCHFSAGAAHFGRRGRWSVHDPGLPGIPPGVRYIATWIE